MSHFFKTIRISYSIKFEKARLTAPETELFFCHTMAGQIIVAIPQVGVLF